MDEYWKNLETFFTKNVLGRCSINIALLINHKLALLISYATSYDPKSSLGFLGISR